MTEQERAAAWLESRKAMENAWHSRDPANVRASHPFDHFAAGWAAATRRPERGGWKRIESEADLPKVKGDYVFRTKAPRNSYLFVNWAIYQSEREWWVEHYDAYFKLPPLPEQEVGENV